MLNCEDVKMMFDTSMLFWDVFKYVKAQKHERGRMPGNLAHAALTSLTVYSNTG